MARNLEGLLGNPMFMAGLGLIGSNSWGGAAQGLLAAGQQRMDQRKLAREEEQYAMQKQVQDMQLSELQRKQGAMQRFQAALSAGDQSAAMAALGELEPGALASAMFKPTTPRTVAPGGSLVSPDGTVLYQAPPDPSKRTFEQSKELAALRGGNASGLPSNVQEWEYFSKLPPEQQTQYLTMKRATQYQDLGGAVVAPNPADPGGVPVAVLEKDLPPQDRPETRGAQAAAVAQAEAAAKKQASMSGINDILNQAEQILLNSKPTGSGAGAMTDAVMGFAGVGTDSAAAADSLEAIGGALVAKMPRMEGPQSNYDVESYRVMAGRVGDRSLPVSRRLAALRTVRQLWAKYEHLNRDAPTDAAPAGGGRSIDDLLNKYGTQ